MKQIEVTNLSFSYEQDSGKKPILNHVTLQFEKGQFVAVLGHNGSGKSTFAKHLNAILLPKEGTVLVDGIDTKDEEMTFTIRQKMGMVFQNPDNQLVATVVEEDVAFAPENLGVPPEEIRKRVDDALEAVGMSSRRLSAPHELSGGQKQRVAIAGIIAMRPECIVMDEPTAMLDPHGRRRVMATIKVLKEQYGITVILITHFMSEAVLADRVVVLSDGEVLLDGTPREVFSQGKTLTDAGLELPQVTRTAELLRGRGIPVEGVPLTVEEFTQAFLKSLEG